MAKLTSKTVAYWKSEYSVRKEVTDFPAYLQGKRFGSDVTKLLCQV